MIGAPSSSTVYDPVSHLYRSYILVLLDVKLVSMVSCSETVLNPSALLSKEQNKVTKHGTFMLLSVLVFFLLLLPVLGAWDLLHGPDPCNCRQCPRFAKLYFRPPKKKWERPTALDSRGTAILPFLKDISAVPVHQSAPEKAVALSRCPRIKESLPLHQAGCSLSKSASQTHAAQLLFRRWPSLKVISAVPVHQSAPKNAVALSTYPRIKGASTI